MRQAPCPHFLDAFSDFVDDRLTPERRMELQAHLDSCEACLRHLAAYRRGVMVYRALEVERADAEPGALFEAVERRLWLEGHLGRRKEADAGSAGSGSPTRFGLRALGVAAAAVLAFALVRPPAPADSGPSSDPGIPVARTDAPIGSDEPTRVASVPIEVPSEVERDRSDRPGAGRIGARSSEIVPVRLATPASIHPTADLAVEQRLADAQSRLRRMTWETPVSITDGWNRPRIGGAPIVRTVAATSAGPGSRSGSTPSPWGVEAALVVP